MFLARHVLRARAILLFALITLCVVVGPSIASAQQLDLSWVDNSGGQASFIIQRAPGISGPFAQIAEVPVGIVSYTDVTVSLGTTYCYQVAAMNTSGVSAFSNVACASPSGGFTVTAVKAGTGAGTVTSSPAGIDCGTTCSYTYLAGKVVTLTATPSSGSNFTGWSGGGCSGIVPCTLAGNASVTLTATFAPAAAVTAGITVSATTAPPGGSITATLSSSPGGSSDWLALAAVGTPNTSYLQWVYVGAGVTNRTWTLALPNAAGSYEFRLYLNNGFTVAARSPAISILGPGPGITVSATTAPPGGSITATLSSSPGGSSDWLALAAVGTPNTSYLQWVYVGAGVTNRTWTLALPNAAGSYEFRLYLNNGFTVSARSPAVSVGSTATP